jgi:hypothetical protein
MCCPLSVTWMWGKRVVRPCGAPCAVCYMQVGQACGASMWPAVSCRLHACDAPCAVRYMHVGQACMAHACGASCAARCTHVTRHVLFPLPCMHVVRACGGCMWWERMREGKEHGRSWRRRGQGRVEEPRLNAKSGCALSGISRNCLQM